MDAALEQLLITKVKALSPQQIAEVVDFVEFLAAKAARRAAIDRLLTIAPALEAAGVAPMSEEEIAAEVKAARAERRARLAAASASSAAGDEGADRPRDQRGVVGTAVARHAVPAARSHPSAW
jgi:hypothetical protein